MRSTALRPPSEQLQPRVECPRYHQPENERMTQKARSIRRRDFLKGTAAMTAGFTIINPRSVRGSQANSAVRLGILGVGGRGTAVGSGFVTNAGVRVTTLADLFADQLEAGRAHFDGLQAKAGAGPLAPSQLFRGPDCYKQIADAKDVDVIQISTPPYFHPLHLEAVVGAGKHAYCEKPVAVDVPGAKRVIEIGKRAGGRLSLDVGFQIRKAPPMVELEKRIRQGAIGAHACGEAFYYCPHIDRPAWPNASPDEQHVRDMCNWFLRGHPVKAVASCARKVRPDTGDCKDNFNAVVTYPGDVQVTFGSTQFGSPEFDAGVRLFGVDGSSESHYDWRVKIAGKHAWDAGLGEPGGADSRSSASDSSRGALDEADSE